MKKLILLAFVLSACQTAIDSDPCAAPDGTYVASYTEEWEGIEFQLPRCWTRDDSTAGQLILRDGENFVQMSTSEFEVVEGPTVELTKTAPDGTMLYISVYDSEDSQVQLILDSIEWMGASQEPETSSTACDAPNYTYPLLTYESWNGIEFGLPWCWTATEEGETLRLEHGEGEAWVNITMGSGTLPNPLPSPTRTDHEEYTLFDYEGYLYLETNNPNHSNVQDILYSISL